MIPILLTSSEIIVSGQKMYSLLFEPIRNRGGAIITTCQQNEIIQSASDNISTVLGVRARALFGKSLASLFGGAQVVDMSLAAKVKSKYGAHGKHLIGAPIEVTATSADGPVNVIVEVIDSRNNMFVLTIKHKSSYAAPVKSLSFSSEKTVDMKTAKGGVDPNQQLAEEEIGYYTVTGALGVGQCGMVRQGTHRTTGTQVAVKTLTKETFAEVGLAWPGKELELMKYLNHPNIVQLYDCVMSSDRLFLVMELVSGGELLSYCFDAGPLPEGTARTFFRDILGAVDYLHRKGIVHRDLKLENCLLDDSQHVKLIDFGLANFYLAGTLRTSCGSADYAAPELFTSSMYYGPPVDVWAMGVMLFSMIAGEFPFDDIQATLDGDYRWPETPSKSLVKFVSEVFELNPDLRLTVEQMRRNEWVNSGFRGPPERPAIVVPHHSATTSSRQATKDAHEVRRDVLNLRHDVLVVMEKDYGFVTEAAVESILSEDINQFTATYKMLLLKYARFDAPCESVELERVKVIVNDVQRQLEIGQVGRKLNLPHIRSAVKLRHRSGFSSGTSSAPVSPRDASPRQLSDILSTDQLQSAVAVATLAVSAEKKAPSSLPNLEGRQKKKRPSSGKGAVRSLDETGTVPTVLRERSSTFGGSPSKQIPIPNFGKLAALQQQSQNQDVVVAGSPLDIARRLSMAEDLPAAHMDDELLESSNAVGRVVERNASRSRLTGGTLSAVWKAMRNSSETFEREHKVVMEDHGS